MRIPKLNISCNSDLFLFPLQWVPEGDNVPDIVMLTADLAMDADPSYSALTATYAEDLAQLETDFAASWYRLSTRDMGDYNRCVGDMVPGPQAWQQPLPDPPAEAPDATAVREAVHAMIDDGTLTTAQLTRLAFQCASTYRQTDHSGGCNGYVETSLQFVGMKNLFTSINDSC